MIIYHTINGMNKIRKISIIALIFVTILLTLSINALAVTPYYAYSCSRGVSVYYYIENGNANDYHPEITAATNNWVHTGHGANPIYLYEKSASSGTAIDFYNRTTTFWGDANVLGETYHRNSSGTRVYPWESHWLYSEIYLNTSSLGQKSTSLRQGTIAHEIGHAFGLAHYNTNPNGSIMCQTGSGRTVQTVQAEDNEAINEKY